MIYAPKTCRYCGDYFEHGIGSHEVWCKRRPSMAKEVMQHLLARTKPDKLTYYARKIDQNVEITTLKQYQVKVYHFSDKSTLTALGRGENFAVQLEERISDERID